MFFAMLRFEVNMRDILLIITNFLLQEDGLLYCEPSMGTSEQLLKHRDWNDFEVCT